MAHITSCTHHRLAVMARLHEGKSWVLTANQFRVLIHANDTYLLISSASLLDPV